MLHDAVGWFATELQHVQILSFCDRQGTTSEQDIGNCVLSHFTEVSCFVAILKFLYVICNFEPSLQERDAEALEHAATRAKLQSAEEAVAELQEQLQLQTASFQQLVTSVIKQQQVWCLHAPFHRL